MHTPSDLTYPHTDTRDDTLTYARAQAHLDRREPLPGLLGADDSKGKSPLDFGLDIRHWPADHGRVLRIHERVQAIAGLVDLTPDRRMHAQKYISSRSYVYLH